MAFIVWCQYIGPTIFLALYNTIFVTSLRPQIHEQAPRANADAIIAAGATNFRKIVSPGDIPGVLIAYSNSLDRVFYLVAAAGVVAWCAAWGMGWKDIRKAKEMTSYHHASTAKIDGNEQEKDNSSPDRKDQHGMIEL